MSEARLIAKAIHEGKSTRDLVMLPALPVWVKLSLCREWPSIFHASAYRCFWLM